MTNTSSAITGAVIGIIAFFVFVMVQTGVARADSNDMLRQIGIEMLKDAYRQHIQSINYEPPGYFLSGLTVRVG